jgi:hypothetical protein
MANFQWSYGDLLGQLEKTEIATFFSNMGARLNLNLHGVCDLLI